MTTPKKKPPRRKKPAAERRWVPPDDFLDALAELLLAIDARDDTGAEGREAARPREASAK